MGHSTSSETKAPAKGRAFALQNLAAATHAQDDYERAERLHEESLRLFRELGDKPWIGFSLTHLGFGALARGDYAQALERLEEALGYARETQDTRQIGIALQLMGEVELAQEHFTPASSLLEESLGLVREARDKVDIATTLRLLGIVARCQGDYERATALQQESLELSREVNLKEFEAESLCELGIIENLQGRTEAAGNFLRSALAGFDLSEQFGIARCLENLAIVAGRESLWERSAQLFGAAQALRERIGSPLRPYEMSEHNAAVDGLRHGLGPEDLDRGWKRGATMTLQQVTGFALRPEPERIPVRSPGD